MLNEVLSYPLPGPALLLKKVKYYNTPVFVDGPQTVRRIAITLALDPNIDEVLLFKEYASRLDHPLEPVNVKHGACQGKKYCVDEVDVLKSQVPWWNEQVVGGTV